MDFQQLSTFCDGIPGLDRRWRSIEDLPDDGVGKRDLPVRAGLAVAGRAWNRAESPADDSRNMIGENVVGVAVVEICSLNEVSR